MNRRQFLQTTALGTGLACASASKLFAGVNGDKYPELGKHKIEKVELQKYDYITHLAAACGNVVTIEGVTCLSDDIDYGDYKIENGRIRVSDRPGFGMKLLK